MIISNSKESFSDLALSEQNSSNQVSHIGIGEPVYKCGCPLCKESLSTVNGQLSSSLLDSQNISSSKIDNKAFDVNTLLESEEIRWNSNSALGTPVAVSYSFMTSLPSYYKADENGTWTLSDGIQASNFAPFSTEKGQIQAAIQALNLWEEVSGLTFVEDKSGNGQIRFGSASASAGVVGWAYPPGDDRGGDVWLNVNDATNNNPTQESFGFQTLIHEIGHALGLKHPFDGSPTLTGAENSFQYTNMAYDKHPDMQGSTPGIPGGEGV